MTNNEDSSSTKPFTLLAIIGIMGTLVGVLEAVLPTGWYQPVVAVVIGFLLTVFLVKRSYLDAWLAFGIWLVSALVISLLYASISQPATLSGSVIDDTGKPVVNESFVVIDSSGVSHTIVTNENGEFQISTMPEGNYDVMKNDKRLIGGTVPSGWDRLTRNIIAVGNIYYNPIIPTPSTTLEASSPDVVIASPSEETTPALDVQPTTIPADDNDIFAQASDTGAEGFAYSLPLESLKFDYISDCSHTGEVGLWIDYNYSGEQFGGWGLTWTKSSAGRFNASAFTHLELWVKGARGSELFQIKFRDMSGLEDWYQTGPNIFIPRDKWTQIDIRLSMFPKIAMSFLTDVSFGFNKDHGAGTVCIDDVAFVIK